MRRLLALCVLALALFLTARASAAFNVPPLTGFVVDPSSKLADYDRRSLETELDAYRQKRKHHIVVLVVDSLGGDSIDHVAKTTLDTWKLGDKATLLVLAPTEQKIRIVGGSLTDRDSNQIIDYTIAPRIRENQFYEGVRDGTRAIESALAGEPVMPHADKELDLGTMLVGGLVILVALGFFAFVVRVFVRRGKVAGSHGDYMDHGSGYYAGGDD